MNADKIVKASLDFGSLKSLKAAWHTLTNWLPQRVARVPASVHLKLLAAFLVIVLLLITVGAVGLQALGEGNRRAEEIVALQRKVLAYRQLQHDTTTQLYNVASALVSPDERTLDSTLRQLNQFGYDLDRLQYVSKDEEELFAQIQQDYKQFIQIVTQVIELIRAGKVTQGYELQRTQAATLADRLERRTNQLVNRAQAEMVARTDLNQAAYLTSQWAVIGFAVGSITLALLLGYAISWSVINPVRQMNTRLSEIASGDFSQQVAITNRDELGTLGTNLNRMNDELGRLYAEIRTRNHELSEALEQQTAMSEILRVIASSPTDIQPVLDIVAKNAMRLCDADDVSIFNKVSHTLQLVLHHGPIATFQIGDEVPLSRDWAAGRAVVDRQTIHVHDLAAETVEFPQGAQGAQRFGHRTILVTPLLREDIPIGTIVIRRAEVRSFTEQQIKLLELFATQAAIAIENVRLFHALEEKTQQLEIANQHKSEFLANMSHELRTPLNAINGFSEVLLEKLFGDLNPKQEEYLRDILTSGQHLLNLINDILDISKVEAGRMELERTRFDLREALHNSLMMIRERTTRHAIQLNLNMDETIGEIEADERKVKQVIFNLLSNAVKFTPDGGCITMTAQTSDSTVTVAVQDTGIGIAPDEQARIFEEFQQAKQNPLQKQEGTGLGLTLAKKFVELHGGRIWVESAVGKGSCFTFTIPMTNV